MVFIQKKEFYGLGPFNEISIDQKKNIVLILYTTRDY